MNNTLVRLRILIVDDIPEHAERLKRLLHPLEHTILTTTSSAEAVKLISAKTNLYNPIDVAIIDYFMPVLNGVELGKKLKKIDPDLSLIILTSDASRETAKEILSADLPTIGFVTKKEDISIIVSALNYMLANKEIRMSGEHSWLRERTAGYNGNEPED